MPGFSTHMGCFCRIAGVFPPAVYVNPHENCCLLIEDSPGWNMYQKCLRRKKISALNEPGEYLNTKTLSLQEWIFVFERVGIQGRNVRRDMEARDAHNKSTDKARAELSVIPEAAFILDLRYIVCSIPQPRRRKPAFVHHDNEASVCVRALDSRNFEPMLMLNILLFQT